MKCLVSASPEQPRAGASPRRAEPCATRRLRFRMRGAAILAGVLLTLVLTGLAGAAHLKHHLDDPHCGADPLRHECVTCSGLHASALTASSQQAEASVLVLLGVTTLPEQSVVPRAPRGDAAPRAPPIA